MTGMDQLVHQYGYWAVLLGTIMEGETVLIAGGVAAKLGMLNIWIVIACAAVGGFVGDQLFFAVGHHLGASWFDRHPKWNRKIHRIRELVRRHENWLIVFCRFMYGMRILTPAVLGTCRVPRLKFIVLNAMGACVWGALFGTLGYLLGLTAQRWLRHFQDQFHWLVIGLAVLAAGALIWYLRRRKS